MSTVSLEEIQKDLLGCLERVQAGETLLVTRGDLPVAEIKPVRLPPAGPRPFGLAAGLFTVPDDFDAPLPDEVLDAFEGK